MCFFRMKGTFWRFLVILPLVVTACTQDTSQETGETKERRLFKMPKKIPSVVTAPVQTNEIPLVINTQGHTEASDRFEAKAPSNVKVQKVFVEEGAKVEAGEALVKFDDQEAKLRLAKAQAEVKEAEAGISYTGFLKQNKEKLLQEEKMTETEAEGVDEHAALYRATLDRAKAEIELYEGLTDFGQLNSPIAGVVTKKSVSDGSDAAHDQVLLEVIRLDPVQFIFNVPSDSAPGLEKGSEIVVRFVGFPGQDFSGELASIGAETKSEASGVEVKVNLPNPELLLKAGMRGNIVIHTQATQKVFLVPEAALVRAEKTNHVFKLEGRRVKKISVEVGEVSNGQVVLNKGVGDGDQVVVEPDEELKDGVQVEATLKSAGGTS